jgi:hypothetical protein
MSKPPGLRPSVRHQRERCTKGPTFRSRSQVALSGFCPPPDQTLTGGRTSRLSKWPSASWLFTPLRRFHFHGEDEAQEGELGGEGACDREPGQDGTLPAVNRYTAATNALQIELVSLRADTPPGTLARLIRKSAPERLAGVV